MAGLHLWQEAKGGNEMFKNILLPVDGSEHALRAVDAGIQLAGQLQAKVYGVHVLPPLNTVSYVSELLQSRGCYTDVSKKRAQEFLDEVSKRAAAVGVACETEYVFDLRPYVAIVATAAKHQCDLIVMGSRGFQGLERILLGSVTHKVMLSCDIPVLVWH
jgi:nucleotide-binding universal stress UspA family protein